MSLADIASAAGFPMAVANQAAALGSTDDQIKFLRKVDAGFADWLKLGLGKVQQADALLKSGQSIASLYNAFQDGNSVVDVLSNFRTTATDGVSGISGLGAAGQTAGKVLPWIGAGLAAYDVAKNWGEPGPMASGISSGLAALVPNPATLAFAGGVGLTRFLTSKGRQYKYQYPTVLGSQTLDDGTVVMSVAFTDSIRQANLDNYSGMNPYYGSLAGKYDNRDIVGPSDTEPITYGLSEDDDTSPTKVYTQTGSDGAQWKARVAVFNPKDNAFYWINSVADYVGAESYEDYLKKQPTKTISVASDNEEGSEDVEVFANPQEIVPQDEYNGKLNELFLSAITDKGIDYNSPAVSLGKTGTFKGKFVTTVGGDNTQWALVDMAVLGDALKGAVGDGYFEKYFPDMQTTETGEPMATYYKDDLLAAELTDTQIALLDANPNTTVLDGSAPQTTTADDVPADTVAVTPADDVPADTVGVTPADDVPATTLATLTADSQDLNNNGIPDHLEDARAQMEILFGLEPGSLSSHADAIRGGITNLSNAYDATKEAYAPTNVIHSNGLKLVPKGQQQAATQNQEAAQSYLNSLIGVANPYDTLEKVMMAQEIAKNDYELKKLLLGDTTLSQMDLARLQAQLEKENLQYQYDHKPDDWVTGGDLNTLQKASALGTLANSVTAGGDNSPLNKLLGTGSKVVDNVIDWWNYDPDLDFTSDTTKFTDWYTGLDETLPGYSDLDQYF